MAVLNLSELLRILLTMMAEFLLAGKKCVGAMSMMVSTNGYSIGSTIQQVSGMFSCKHP
jgi:uncharacterized membrane protein YcaP (DUF421 family)